MHPIKQSNITRQPLAGVLATDTIDSPTDQIPDPCAKSRTVLVSSPTKHVPYARSDPSSRSGKLNLNNVETIPVQQVKQAMVGLRSADVSKIVVKVGCRILLA
jgi:hypothetical protein